jgi:hypothetical protein
MNDFTQKKQLLESKSPDEEIEVIFTNSNAKISHVFLQYPKIKEKDIIFTKEAIYGANYNDIVDQIWFRIRKR